MPLFCCRLAQDCLPHPWRRSTCRIPLRCCTYQVCTCQAVTFCFVLWGCTYRTCTRKEPCSAVRLYIPLEKWLKSAFWGRYVHLQALLRQISGTYWICACRGGGFCLGAWGCTYAVLLHIPDMYTESALQCCKRVHTLRKSAKIGFLGEVCASAGPSAADSWYIPGMCLLVRGLLPWCAGMHVRCTAVHTGYVHGKCPAVRYTCTYPSKNG